MAQENKEKQRKTRTRQDRTLHKQTHIHTSTCLYTHSSNHHNIDTIATAQQHLSNHLAEQSNGQTATWDTTEIP